MITDLKPYPAMKDSGVPWLGEVPEHWGVERLKARAANIIEQTDERPSGGLYVALEHVESWTGRLRDVGSETSFESQVKRFRPGDVLFGKLRPYLAKVARPTREGVCAGEFFVLRSTANGVSEDYLAHLLRSKSIIDAIDSSTFGAKMPRADWHFVGNLALSFPPIPEQAAIVRFLGHADRRIRRYIRAKQKLIKLLEEQKQAIIHRAVTRGVGSDDRLKPSGVEWLREVPEHWKVQRTKQCASKISKGTTPSTEGHEILESGPVRFIKAESVSGGRIIDKPSCFIDEQTNKVLRRSQLCDGDILFVIAGATLGKTAVVHSEHLPANTNQAVAFIRPNRHVNGNFLSLWLQSPRIRELIWLNAVQSAQPNLSMEDLGNFVVPTPPVIEQDRIVDTVRMKLALVDETVDRAQREISLLREYRTRLIADVVTGKLDVRAAAANLPDESEAPEALDGTDALAEDAETADGDLGATPEEAEA